MADTILAFSFGFGFTVLGALAGILMAVA